MTTWTEFLAEIRADLKDDGATPRFSDKMLYVYTKDAVRDYSIWFPRRLDAVVLSPVGASYPLPANFISEIHVETAVGSFLERRAERPGTRFPNRKQPIYYFIQGGNLYVVCPTVVSPLADIKLTYLATHAIPVSETDVADPDATPPYPGFTFTIPDADIELIRLYVKAQLYIQMRTRQSALDRFKERGSRDDNPLQPETLDLMRDYRAKIAERIAGGVISLYRSGRFV
jgi:hypothetical protein